MNIVSFEQVGIQAWDAFCETSSEAWLRHTSTFIAFAQTLGTESKNHSFAVTHDNELIAVVPLIAQSTDAGLREFAMGGTPTPFPALRAGLSHDEQKEVSAMVFTEIDRRAAEHTVTSLRMFVDPLTDPVLEKKLEKNPLLQFGFIDDSIQTSSVDLHQNEEELLMRIQERRRKYIRAALKAGYTAEFFDERNITDELCAVFEMLYLKDAGRVVGTPERWRLTWDMVRTGYGVLFLVRTPNEEGYCAGRVVLAYKNKAYDGLTARDPSHEHDSLVGPFMHYADFRYFKARGFSRFEVGWILPSTPPGLHSKKELDISYFKARSGGDLLPLWRGEKRYQ